MTDPKEEAREGYARRHALDGIKYEPRTYSPYSPHSYFQDLGLLVAPRGEPGREQAVERLERHRDEIDGEIRNGSTEGRMATRLRRQEARAAGTTTATTAGFTTPQYLIDQWVAYRTPYRTFVDSTVVLPLPEVGVQINVPSLTSGTTTGFQSELSGIDISYPTGTDIQQTVIAMSGAVSLAQQLHDRGGMPGLTFDTMMIQQLKISIDSQTDNYILSQVIGGVSGGNVISQASYSNANFWANVGSARAAIADAAGTRLKATHIFTTTDMFSFISAQVDDQHRPIFTPDWAAQPWAGLAMRGEDAGDGWTGHVLPGNIAWFLDDNMPTNGSNTYLVVSRPNTILTFEGDPIPFSYVETRATTLTVLVGIRKYIAVGPRFPSAHATISGNAYPLSAS